MKKMYGGKARSSGTETQKKGKAPGRAAKNLNRVMREVSKTRKTQRGK